MEKEKEKTETIILSNTPQMLRILRSKNMCMLCTKADAFFSLHGRLNKFKQETDENVFWTLPFFKSPYYKQFFIQLHFRVGTH